MTDHKEYIANLRYDYSQHELDETSADKNPILQFETWFKEAIGKNILDANAMILSTASPDGKPSARVLLLRSFDEKGFGFYTNYNSRKGKEIEANPYAAMTFFWSALERQVRIEGMLEKQNPEESDAYFASRPSLSKIGAWASPQSEVIKNRTDLEVKLEEISKKFPGEDVPRPSFWGGYYLRPSKIEFWQGRPNRLHDRILYTRQEDRSWLIERLAP